MIKLFLICFFNLLAAREVSVAVTRLQAPAVAANSEITLTLEYANTPEKTEWGLMRRTFLPENHGMLFYFDRPHRAHLWSFNCWMDLSIAFLDANGMIGDIHALKAHPERMDPNRPVFSLADMSRYPYNDPIIRFFSERSVIASFPASYALEMTQGWFQENARVGDMIVWNEKAGTASLIRTWNVNALCPCDGTPLLVLLPGLTAQSIFSKNPLDMAFLDGEQRIVQMNDQTPFVSEGPVKYLFIAPSGWFSENGIRIGDELAH